MKEQIIDILCSVFENPELKNIITDNTDILNELKIDSIGLINLFIKLEEVFSVEIDTDTVNFKDFRTVSSISNKVNQLIEHQ